MKLYEQIYADNVAYSELADVQIIDLPEPMPTADEDARAKNFTRILKASDFGCQTKSVHMIVREILKLHEIDLLEIPERHWRSHYQAQFEGAISTHTPIKAPILVSLQVDDTGPAKLRSDSLILFTGSRLSSSGNLLLFSGVDHLGVMVPYELHATQFRLATLGECADYVAAREMNKRPLVETRSWGGGVLLRETEDDELPL